MTCLTTGKEESGATGGIPRSNIGMTIILIGAFALGFASVFFLSPRKEPPPPSAQSEAATLATAVSMKETLPDESMDTDSEPETAELDDADAPPEVPPGRTPDGAMITGVLYLKCWNSDDTLHKKDECDALDVLEKRFSSRLYVVDKCRREHASNITEGVLSLGANIDFEKRDIRFWAGPSSDIENAKQIGVCVRNGLAGLPLYEIKHEHERYRVFFSVEFFDPEKHQKKLKKLRRRGRRVKVLKDHVRVRREPVDGFVFGKLGTDTEVTLVNREEDWCRIVTPGDNIGWIICDALDR